MPSELKFDRVESNSFTTVTLARDGALILVPRAFILGWAENMLLVETWWHKRFKRGSDSSMKYSVIKSDTIDCFETKSECLAFARTNGGTPYEWGGKIKGEDEKMPKKSSEVGRKACMDAMCHQCKDFGLEGGTQCVNTTCPLYYYSPYGKATAVLGWERFKPGSSTGFVPVKGTSVEDLTDGVVRAVVFRYGSVDSAPESVRREVESLVGTSTVHSLTGEENGW